MVAHPANLFPSDDPNAPQIVDAADDQLGTTAQDIREGKFRYDAASNQIVYTLTVSDLSVRTPNMRWTMTSSFGQTQIFVTASVDETATTYKYGKITTLATGTRNQETIGAVDSGVISGNQIIIKLGLDKINAAVGSNVLGTVSTGTQANSQILIGSSLSGGLLLNSDSATGSDFEIKGESNPEPTPTPTPTPEPTPTVTPTPTPTPEPTPEPTPSPSPSPTPSPSPEPTPNPPANQGRFEERYSGTINPGQTSVEIAFSVRNSVVDAMINQNHGNQKIYFELLDAERNVIAVADKNKIYLQTLQPGNYFYRVRGSVTKPVDFTIKSGQGR
jgi:cell division septation protein DedD